MSEENAEQSVQTADAEQESSTFDEIAAKMAKIRGESSGDSQSTDENVDETKPTDTEDTQSGVEDDGGKSEAADENALLLPSGHRRAALARGWTTEEVDHYLETRPDEAATRFEELYNERRKENDQWSRRGRELLAAEQNASGADGKKDDEPLKGLDHYDMDALVEKHPDSEGLIRDLVDPLNKQIDRMNETADRLAGSEKFVKDSQDTTLLNISQEFLTSKTMEPYRKTYGTLVKDLTEDQYKARQELFGEADIIVAGAADHGREITVQEALERAHIQVSQGSRDEAIRQGIRDSLRKRTKTQQSSHKRTSSSGDNQPITDEELERRTEARMQEIRNK